MKRTATITAAALALLGLASCTKDIAGDMDRQQSQTREQGLLEVTVIPEEAPTTRATSAYTTAQTYESQANKVQVLVFDAAGAVNFYRNLGTATTASISTTHGAKTVWAVVNGPDLSSVKTLSALQATAVDLGANSTTAATGFVMTGSASCTVGASAVSCPITVKRLAARVALVSVKNSLPASYGAMKVERVFLSNAVGNQNIAGTASPATWYNKEGRADESTRTAAHIIDGGTYKASCPTLTFKSPAASVAAGASYAPATPDLFYCYANSSTTAPAGFNATFAAQRSVLTVAATVNGTLYYYPVVLDDAVIERNKTYTVALTVTGLGSTDPNKPVLKGSVSATVSVAGWEAGAVYDEII